jgi:hypothetical protein
MPKYDFLWVAVSPLASEGGGISTKVGWCTGNWQDTESEKHHRVQSLHWHRSAPSRVRTRVGRDDYRLTEGIVQPGWITKSKLN